MIIDTNNPAVRQYDLARFRAAQAAFDGAMPFDQARLAPYHHATLAHYAATPRRAPKLPADRDNIRPGPTDVEITVLFGAAAVAIILAVINILVKW